MGDETGSEEKRRDTGALIRVGLLGLAVLCLLTGLFAPWWTYQITSNGQNVDFEARPYDAGGLSAKDGNEGLDGEALITGLLATAALITCLIALTVEALPLIGRQPLELYGLLAGLGSTLTGIAAVVYTFFLWPDGADTGPFGMGFFDSQDAGFGVSQSTTGGLGWYLGIVAALATTTASVLMFLQNRSADPLRMAIEEAERSKATTTAPSYTPKPQAATPAPTVVATKRLKAKKAD